MSSALVLALTLVLAAPSTPAPDGAPLPRPELSGDLSADYLIGLRAFRAGRLTAARAAFARVLADTTPRPEYARALFFDARAATLQRRCPEAVAALRRLYQLDPRLFEALQADEALGECL